MLRLWPLCLSSVSQHNLFTRLEREVQELQDPEGSIRGSFVRVNWGDFNEIPEDKENPDQIMDWLDKRGIINDVSVELHKDGISSNVHGSHQLLLVRQEYQQIKNAMERAQQIDLPGQQD